MAGLLDVFKALRPNRNHTLKSVSELLDRAAASTQNTSSGSQEVYPEYRYGYDQLWEISQNSDVLRITHQAIVREILRKGFDLTEAEDSTDSSLPATPTLVTANADQILKKLQNLNANRQDVMDVLEELERDYEVYDDNYLYFRKRYAFNPLGEIIPEQTELQEVLRADPRAMGLVMNNYDEPAMDNDGNPLSFCPEHRDTLLTSRENCGRCGKQTLPACFVYSGRHGKVYYSDSEMMHDSKYWPSKRLGTSPIISIWMKVRTLLYMDKYIMQMYDGQRPPKSILAFKSMNPEAVQKSIDAGLQRMKQDPHFPLTIGIPNSDSGKEFIQFVDLMRSLQDLQHTEVRNELRSQVGAVYGVEPIYQNDVSTGGGLNNEGLQITVTNRAVEWGQRQFNRKILPRLLEELGGHGLRLTLQPSEEQDEQARMNRQRMALENARMASELGLQVEWDEHTEEAVITGGAIKAPSPMGGMFGGAPPNASTGTPSFQPRDAASGTPTSPQIGKGSREAANLGKSRVYLKPGEEAPEGTSVQTGAQGGRYYEKNPQRSLSQLLETDPEDMTDEELDYLQSRMEEDEVTYTQSSLESAKAWLKNHPELRERYGKNYYEFAVEVARSIEEGYDPDDLDWASMDSTIPLADAIEELREKPLPMMMAKAGRAGWTGLGDKLKGLIQDYSERFLNNADEATVKRELERLRKRMITELEAASRAFYEEEYKKAMTTVERELDRNFEFGVVDQNAIRLLSSQPVLYEAYAGLTDELIERTNEILTRAYQTPGGVDRRKLEAQIEEATGLANHRAENIARTETGKVSAAARKNSYQKDDRFQTFRFRHIGPDDQRTTKTSKRIKQRVGSGVPWDEYVQIITEESAKDFPTFKVDPEAPISHFQSRHTFIRVQD